MTQLTAMTGGRAWAARLLILLPIMALIALTVAVVPASADLAGSPPSANGVEPVKLQTVGGDFENCLAAEAFEGMDPGTIEAFAFHNNPRQADGQELPITHPDGEPVEGGWHVVLEVPDEDGHPRSFAYEVFDPDGHVTQSDGLLEAPRKNAKTENLSHVTLCFAQSLVGDDWVAAFVEVKGSQGTNHYNNLTSLACNEETAAAGDGIDGRVFPVCDDEESKSSFFVFDGTEGEQSVSYDTFVEADGFVAALEEWTWTPEIMTSPEEDIRELTYDDGDGPRTAEFCLDDPRDNEEFSLPADLNPDDVLPEGHTTCIIEVTATTVGNDNGDPLVQVTHLLFTIGDPTRIW